MLHNCHHRYDVPVFNNYGSGWRTTFTVYHASPQGLKIIRRWLQTVRSIRPLQNPQLSEMLFHCYRAAWNSSGEVVHCGQLQICKSHSLLTIVMRWKQNPVFYDRTWLCTVIYIWQLDQKTSKFNSTTLLMNFIPTLLKWNFYILFSIK